MPRYRGPVPVSVQIEPLRSAAELEELLPAIAAYQAFYEAEDIDEERNRAFFARFLSPSEDGAILVAREAGEIRGYACLYWHLSSLAAAETVLMNDLFVAEAARGEGVGRALIEASADHFEDGLDRRKASLMRRDGTAGDVNDGTDRAGLSLPLSLERDAGR